MTSRLSSAARSAILSKIAEVFTDFTIDFYTGSQPPSSDVAETGQKLLSITLNSGAFTSGSPTNGLEFGAEASQVLHKKAGEVWSGVGLVDGVAGWARIYGNTKITGSSTTAIRWDLSVGTSGAQINMSNTSIVTGATTTIDTVNIPMPIAA
jgi:hypothetical protein